MWSLPWPDELTKKMNSDLSQEFGVPTDLQARLDSPKEKGASTVFDSLEGRLTR